MFKGSTEVQRLPIRVQNMIINEVKNQIIFYNFEFDTVIRVTRTRCCDKSHLFVHVLCNAIGVRY
jgi:hypothetical protein